MPLEKARAALLAARHELDTLAACDGDFVGVGRARFLHHLPYALERLAAVTRNIDSESRGRRSPAFSHWWVRKDRDSQNAINALRNSALKAYENVTSHSLHITITEREIPRSYGAEVTFEGWTFATGDYKDQEVLSTLETYYHDLRSDLVPTAERLLGL